MQLKNFCIGTYNMALLLFNCYCYQGGKLSKYWLLMIIAMSYMYISMSDRKLYPINLLPEIIFMQFKLCTTLIVFIMESCTVHER
jgi:hypothetical protein